MTDRRRAFRVVDDFEEALCEFTGAPFAVAVDSCTNAVYLALRAWRKFNDYTTDHLEVPKRTYVGVPQAAGHAGWAVRYVDTKWIGNYALPPTNVVDSAKHFQAGMYRAGTMVCVSFQAGKLLPIGRGGAVLLDDEDVVAWLKRARLDGRTEGSDYQSPIFQLPGHHMYMTPDAAARGLWLMTYIEDDDKGDWTEYPDLSQATWT